MKDRTKYLLVIIASLAVVLLVVIDVLLIGKGDILDNLSQLTGSVISDIIAVLISFIVIYLVLESRGVFDESEPVPPILSINPPILSISPSIAELRESLKQDNEIRDLRNKFDNAERINSQSIKDLRVKLEGDLQAIDRKIEEIIKQIGLSSNKIDKSRLGSNLDELLAERNKKASEIENLTESIRISTMLHHNFEELEKLRVQNEVLRQKAQKDEALLTTISSELEKLKSTNKTHSDELQKRATENDELKKLLQANSDEVRKLTDQNKNLNNQIAQLQKADSENLARLKAENKTLEAIVSLYVKTTEKMNAEAKPIINK